MATCFSILAWKIQWSEETGRLQVEMTKNTHTLAHTHICKAIDILMLLLLSSPQPASVS